MNAVELSFSEKTEDRVKAEVRANAVFIHAKLVAAGVDVMVAKRAVEALFDAGHSEGWDDARSLYESSN